MISDFCTYCNKHTEVMYLLNGKWLCEECFLRIFLIYNYELQSYVLSRTFYSESDTIENLLLNTNTVNLLNAIKISIEHRNNNFKGYKIICGNTIY